MSFETFVEESAVVSRRPRLLYVAFYFPPTRASGVYRSRATANHFAQAGWDVTVLTAQREFFRDYIHSFDPALEEHVDPAVRIERVPFTPGLWEPDIRRYGRLRVYAPALWRRLWLRRAMRTFPEAYAPWIEPALGRAVELNEVSQFDAVLATGNPFAAFAVAWKLHRLTSVPYIIDYRDSWTLDMFAEAPAFSSHHPAWSWERRIISNAATVLFVNQPLRDWHARRYADDAERMIVVENGWDPDTLGEVQSPHQPTDGLRFGYLGTLMRQMPLDDFIAGWRAARTQDALHDASAHFYGHLGYFPGGSSRYLGHLAAAGDADVYYEGSVGKTEVRSIYETIDVLLLVIAGSHYVSSGKVYEYIATGRPIVSVHEPFCAASDILRGYPLWFPTASLAPRDIAAALVSAAVAARSLTPAQAADARRFAAGLTRDARLSVLEQELRRIVAIRPSTYVANS